MICDICGIDHYVEDMRICKKCKAPACVYCCDENDICEDCKNLSEEGK